jgi:YetF N-terminal transmembrane domain
MDIVLQAAAVFLLLFIVTRTIGRRELGQLEPFDLILLVVLGDLIQQGVTQSDYSLTGAALAVSTLAVLTVAVSYLSFRVRRLRPDPRRRARRRQPAPGADHHGGAPGAGAPRAVLESRRGRLRGARDRGQDQLHPAQVRLGLACRC